jgi:hypothetical protein
MYKSKYVALTMGLVLSLCLVFSVSFISLQTAHAEDAVSADQTVTSTDIVVTPDVQVITEPTLTEEVLGAYSDASVSDTTNTTTPTQPLVLETPTLSTDKDDYHPGQTATIFGKFFSSLQNIVLKIFGADRYGGDYTETTQNLTADAFGAFTSSYTLDNIFRPFYDVTASDLLGNVLASMTFSDGSTNFDQCANNAGTAGTCSWIGSILHAPNSTYYEGMSVPQRVFFQGVANGAHTVSFHYSYTKGGIHAYDFITSENQGNGSFTPGITNLNACQGLSGGSLTTCTTLRGASPSLVLIPLDGFDSKDSLPLAGMGSTQTDKETTYEAAFGARKIAIYKTTGAFVSGATIAITHDVAANGDTGDSDGILTMNFTLASCPGGGGGSCDILIYFDGHLATGGSDNTTGTNWGPGLGSSAINGGPYHVKNLTLDGSGGSLDNQIQGASILIPNNASITIIKDAVPNDAQDFSFTTTGTGLSSFSLDDDSDVTLVNTKVFSSLAPGTYSVAEGAVSGWTQTSATCTDGSPVTAISLQASENVTCTFTNTLQTGHIIVVKDAVPNDAQDFSFTNNFANGNPSPFSLDDDADGTLSNTRDSVVTAGTYSVSEGAVSGWTATSAICSDGSPINAVVVSPGETVTCTFTNTKDATLTLVKTVNNDNGGTAVANNFQGKIDGGNVPWGVAQVVSASSHAASETVVTGYTAGNWGGDCAANGSVTLSAGQNKTCTITNTDDAPSLTLVKVVDNDNGGTATPANFTLTATGPTGFAGVGPSVSNGASFDAGAYALTESALAGYTAGTWVCVGGTQNGASVTLGLGQSATCTIHNTDNAPKLTLNKIVVNDNGGTSPESAWTLSATGPTTISGPGAVGSTDVVSGASFDAGVYVLSESTGPAGYSASGWTCSNGDNDGTISVALGDDITCTITNNDVAPTLTLVKTVTNDNGGDLEVADFPLFIGGTPATSGTSYAQTANLQLTATETTQTGYAPTVWGGDCAANGTITLLPGDNKTCTITNNDVAPKIIVIKHVINDNGGTAVAGAFTMNVTANSPSLASFPGTENPGTAVTVLPGAYSVTESGPSGYIGTASADCSGTIGIGETKTCTWTNDDTPGHFTGGGSIFPTSIPAGKTGKDNRVTHGFTLHCDASRNPNRLEINWGPANNAQKFHLLNLDSAVCTDNPLIDPQQPRADIDTINGTGTGRYQAGKKNEVPAKITFMFDDAGEPGKNDKAQMRITSLDGSIVFLDTGAPLMLNVGNQQAHQDN